MDLEGEGNGLADFSQCCIETVSKHSAVNPMMLCQNCRNLIKCFEDKNAYLNYVKFCESRNRRLILGQTKKFFIVAFSGFNNTI